jgi:hypothetical protein
MVFLLVMLLSLFLCAFLGLEPFLVNVIHATDVRIVGISLTGTGFRAFLGFGVVFLEFALIVFALLDRVGETIKAVLKPLASLLPLVGFIFSSYQTFAPIFASLLPRSLATQAGIAQNENYLAQAVNDGTFTRNVVVTVVMMLLFVLTTLALSRPGDVSAEIRRLRAENDRFKKFFQ